jgi:hypothetical protein
MSNTETKSYRKLYPDELYDILYKANLIGEGKVIIKGHYSVSTAPRRGEDGVWRDVQVVDRDTTMDNMTIVPFKDVNGRIAGDWTDGLSSEEVKRIHEEAKVPIFYCDHKEHGDTSIKIHHDQEFDLSDPIQMATFKIIYQNNAIATSQEYMTDDQDYYFFSPVEEKRKKKSVYSEKQAAVDLIKELTQEAKFEILEIMTFESKLKIPEGSNEEDKLMIFQDQCWENPKEILRINKIDSKNKRLIIYNLISYNVLLSPNFDFVGPFYRHSVTPGQEYGELLGETIEEAVQNIGKNSNSDLMRQYDKIKNGTFYESSTLENIIQKPINEVEELFATVTQDTKYELPAKITKTWLTRTIRDGIIAYLESIDAKFSTESTTKDLRAKAMEYFNKE